VAVLAGRVPWTQPSAAPLAVALLQGNVSQHVKWNEDVRTKTLLDYRRMVFDAQAARVIVLPETALPAFLDQLPQDYLASLEQFARAGGKDILMGTVEREFHGHDYEYFNSLVSLAGPLSQPYRKRHLVPFGEYIPTGFGWVLAILKIPLSDFSRGAESQPAIAAGGTRFGIAICYEDVFGSEVIKALPAAQVLLNVSNMAWFGDSLAPPQQLQESQMRALETGRWMVRSTNTGVTAAIDERGRVVARLPLFTHATLIANVIPRSGMTPYARAGNLAALAIALALVLAAALRTRSRLSASGPRRL